MIGSWTNALKTRSSAALLTLEQRLDHIIIGWLIVAGLASALRLAASPVPIPAVGSDGILSYALLVLAPAGSILLARRWFAQGDMHPQPSLRLAIVGRWRNVSPAEARSHRLYGTSGIMVSLLIGILLNIPLRAVEYLFAMPPVPAAAPHWVSTLHFAMTADVVLFTSLYGIAFVAALRKVPLFPRMLLTIWVLDLAMQLLVANMVVAAGIPGSAGAALETLLMGNVQKVLISASLWLPYLILSTRVNVTFRNRVPA